MIKNEKGENQTLQATAAIRPLFLHDPMKPNHPRNSNDSLGLVA
ncbi:hypothetical protein VDG1235_4262 [Verrucomicrobiia bacterium DG1235]|nr:hypothetical protein VDG1235_4262 [Verrucomicrobiae bacterium DG1235]